jgi:uncharacterized protein YggE
MGLVTLMPTAGRAQTPDLDPEIRTIRVTGTGEVRTEPDLATVQFAVETTGATAQEAGQRNAQQMERVIQALIGGGVEREDVQTSGYSLYPEYANPEPRGGAVAEGPRITGYRASNQVSVRTADLDRVGRLIDVGLAAGANRMNGVFFELRNAEQAKAEALERAVVAARTTAETMARALGVTLGPVIDASTGTEPVRPLFRAASRDMMMAEAGGFAAPTPIEPGEQTVTAFASLIFGIR